MTIEKSAFRGEDTARKTRALRKYEAAPVPVGSDGGDPPMDVLAPFGPVIGRSGVAPDLLLRINAFADRLTSSGDNREFLVPP